MALFDRQSDAYFIVFHTCLKPWSPHHNESIVGPKFSTKGANSLDLRICGMGILRLWLGDPCESPTIESESESAGCTKSQFVQSLKSPNLSGINTSTLITAICIFGRHMWWISGEREREREGEMRMRMTCELG